MMQRRMFAAVSAAALALSLSGSAAAAPVPVELVLAVDASGSINATNYALQRNAYLGVLGSSLITTDGTIAIGVIEFGFNVQTVFNLTVIDSVATKNSLLAAIAGMNRNGINTGATSIGSAINAAQAMLAGSNHANANQVIDVSTDGFNNAGDNVANAMNAANAAGTVVNCLGVGASASCAFMNTAANVGLGGFSILAPDFESFEDALTRKIAQETGQVPEPTLMTLAGFGLIGLVVRRRVRR